MSKPLQPVKIDKREGGGFSRVLRRVKQRTKRWLKHGFLPRLIRKTIRLMLYELFHEVERSRLTSEMVLAEMKKISFVRVSGTTHEIVFWDRLLAQGMDPNAKKRQVGKYHLDYLQELTKRFPVDQVSILDVGSGPFTTIGAYFGDVQLNITAVDPLAPYYECLARKYAIDRPVKTIFAEAEKLSASFAPESFVWVNAENSIDHTSQPVDAIREMIALVKPGGMLTLRHRTNEAELELYSGFHQWNFFQENGIFYVCGRERSAAVNINEMVPSGWEVRVYNSDWGGKANAGDYVYFELRRP